jgi:hypothetical protein
MGKVEFLKARYNSETETTEITFIEDGAEKLLTLKDEYMHELIETVPLFNEEKEQRRLLKQIYEIIERRHLKVEELDKKIEALQTEHQDLRNKLSSTTIAKDKLAILRYASMISSLKGQKPLIDAERLLLRMLIIEEADLRAQLARREAGRK